MGRLKKANNAGQDPLVTAAATADAKPPVKQMTGARITVETRRKFKTAVVRHDTTMEKAMEEALLMWIAMKNAEDESAAND